MTALDLDAPIPPRFSRRRPRAILILVAVALASALTLQVHTHWASLIEKIRPAQQADSDPPGEKTRVGPEPLPDTLKPVPVPTDNLPCACNGACQAVELQTLHCTPNHPFWVKTRGWTAAEDLRPGDELLTWTGEPRVVLNTETKQEEAETYNFEVQGWHSYFVAEYSGAAAVWVHNRCKFDWDHIFERHSQGGAITGQRTREGATRFGNITRGELKRRVKAAWKNKKRIATQADPATSSLPKGLQVKRVKYRGVDPESGQAIELWYNPKTKTIETAYPVSG